MRCLQYACILLCVALAGCNQGSALNAKPVTFPGDTWSTEQVDAYTKKKMEKEALIGEQNNLKDIYALLRLFRQDTRKPWPSFHFDTTGGELETMLTTAKIFEYLAFHAEVDPMIFVSPQKKNFILDPPRSYDQIQKKPNLDWARSYALDWSAPMQADTNRILIAMREPMEGRLAVCYYDGGVDALDIIPRHECPPLEMTKGDRRRLRLTLDSSGEKPVDFGVLAPLNITDQADDIFSNWGRDEGPLGLHYGGGSRLRSWVK